MQKVQDILWNTLVIFNPSNHNCVLCNLKKGTRYLRVFVKLYFVKKADDDDARKWDQVDMKTHFLDINAVLCDGAPYPK